MPGALTIMAVEGFMRGSHAAFLHGLRRHSRHRYEVVASADLGWREAMRFGGVTLGRLAASSGVRPDLLLVTDMVDLPSFLATARRAVGDVPTVLYFHENQISYPVRKKRPHSRYFGISNCLSALAADVICFNSAYHRHDFFTSLRHVEFREVWPWLDEMEQKSLVAPVGIEGARLDQARHEPADGPPVVLWNARWEHDKDPDTFFAALLALASEGVPFDVVIAGEAPERPPRVFEDARRALGSRVRHFGFAADYDDYARLLWRADVVVSTAKHEFFGIGVVEAMYCGCMPLLPNRLSYPEIVAPEARDLCLYDRPSALIERLRFVLGRPEARRGHDWRAMAARFDWRRLAPAYDALFEAVAARTSQTGRTRTVPPFDAFQPFSSRP